jgi:hypothetical protein
MLIAIKRLIERELVKQQLTNFIVVWSSLVVSEVGNKFYHNFKASMQVDLLGYRGVNFGSITSTLKQAQQWAKVRMQAKREVATSLQ